MQASAKISPNAVVRRRATWELLARTGANERVMSNAATAVTIGFEPRAWYKSPSPGIQRTEKRTALIVATASHERSDSRHRSVTQAPSVLAMSTGTRNK